MAAKRNPRAIKKGLAPEYLISTSKRRLDVTMIHRFLRSAYWAKDIPRKVVEQSIKHSFCFGAFCGGRQIGFGRVVTDFATFAYIADVFVLPEHRGRGVAKQILRAILGHPKLHGLRRFLLATADAHKLYAQFGFQPLAHPNHYLTIHQPDIYRVKRR